MYDNNVRLELTRFYTENIGTKYIIYVEHITGKFIQEKDNIVEFIIYRNVFVQ